MNIWYLSAYDQPKGHSSRTYDFSKELVRLGHKVTLFTNSYCHFTHVERLQAHERWRFEEIDGIRVVWLKTIPYGGNGWRRGANMISNAMRAIQVSRVLTDRPDVVIGPSVPLGTGWAALHIAQQKGAAFVFEVRDVWPQALVDLNVLNNKSLLYKVFRKLEKFLYKKAVRISAVLPYTWKHVEDGGGDSSKVTWIPNGVNLDRFINLPKYSGGEKPLIVMYVGGFSVTHDVSTIINTAKILEENGESSAFQFIIVGDGRQRASCEELAGSLQLSNLKFLDSVTKSEVASLQANGDILVASVKDTPVYQFGINSNKIYDYLASERPIIFSGKAPNDPIVESSAGFSIPPEDADAMAEALLRLLDMSPGQRVQLGKNGRKYVEEQFDLQKLALRMESLLLQATQDKEKVECN